MWVSPFQLLNQQVKAVIFPLRQQENTYPVSYISCAIKNHFLTQDQKTKVCFKQNSRIPGPLANHLNGEMLQDFPAIQIKTVPYSIKS